MVELVIPVPPGGANAPPVRTRQSDKMSGGFVAERRATHAFLNQCQAFTHKKERGGHSAAPFTHFVPALQISRRSAANRRTCPR